MDSIRSLIRKNEAAVTLLLVATLLLKILVPTGYMVSSQNMVLTISICADSTGDQLQRQISIPMKNSGTGNHEQTKSECPFTALAMAGVGGADLALLASALAFVLALGFAPQRMSELRETPRLRPPSRGPPRAA